jgi:hypothetical protein
LEEVLVMHLPFRVIVTLAIIVGIAAGTGALVYGLQGAGGASSDADAFTAWGAAILAGSVAGLIAHLAGGFRGLDDEHE